MPKENDPLGLSKETSKDPTPIVTFTPEAEVKVAPLPAVAVPDITSKPAPGLNWDKAFSKIEEVRKGYERFKGEKDDKGNYKGRVGFNPHFFLVQIDELEAKAKNKFTREASLHEKIMGLQVEDCSIEALQDRGFLSKVVIPGAPVNIAPKPV